MPAGSTAKLYTTDLLSLATELAQYPIAGDWQREATVRSRTCGSSLQIGVRLDDAGSIREFGLAVSACAVGQAAAAIFAKSAIGLSGERAAQALEAIESWLNRQGTTLPDWPNIDALAAAREHTGRHGAILLPWKAAAQALCKDSPTR